MAHITIPAGEPRVSYTPGGSSAGPFNVTFPIFATSDLVVVVGGVELASSDWTFTPIGSVSGGYQSGTITLDAATTEEVVIYRDVTRSRTSDYAMGPLDMDALNTDEDKNVARDQDARLLIDRSLRAPAHEVAMDELPDAETRANQYLIFDADGQPTVAAASVDSASVSAFMETLLDDADAATARATLGVTLASDAEFLARSATNRVLTPGNLASRPYFTATKSADQTGIADGTWTKVTFPTETSDVGSYYDAAGSKWTPPAGPVVLFSALYLSGTIADGAAAYGSIYKNGAARGYLAPVYAQRTSLQFLNVSILDVANGSDYYEVYVYIDVTSSTGIVELESVATFFEGIWLG